MKYEYPFKIACIIILIIATLLSFVMSERYEAIDTDSLDRVCKELLDSQSASYQEEIGFQQRFTCYDQNKIFIIKKYAKLNEVLP